MALGLAGCAEQGKRLNAPPQGATTRPSPMQEQFVYMVDNGMLADSSVADIHFEPHLADLSGLGVRRVMRLGELLSVAGGTIHYETAEANRQLVDARLNSVRDFLKSNGFDTTLIKVDAGLPASGTMTATDAIEVRHNASGPFQSASSGANPQASGAQ
jgi:hypothetical protein